MKLDYARDALLSLHAREMLEDRYMTEDETSPQEAFARACQAFSDDEHHAQRLYDYVSKQWFMFATPVLSNGGLERGLPISCFLSYVPDSLDGITDHWKEVAYLSAAGGGVGGYWGDLRSEGASTSRGSQSSGSIPFQKVIDVEMLAVSQGRTRRGSYATYLDISHPEIEEFLVMRKPSGGDEYRKTLNLHHGVNVPDEFMEIIEACMFDPEADDSWDLIDPNSLRVIRTVSAKALWQKLLETRVATGEPYIHFIDASNRALPQPLKDQDLSVRQSNLCVAPETKILTDQGHVEIASAEGSTVRVWNGEEFSETEVFKTGENQRLVTVTMSDGSKLDCTPYHKFYVEGARYSGRYEERRAHELKAGDRLIKWSAPVIEEGDAAGFENAYRNGFFSGDGTYGRDKPIVYLYGEKRELVEEFEGAYNSSDRGPSERITLFYRKEDMWPKFTVPHGATLESRLEWLAGLSDADGCISRNGENQSMQIASTENNFLEEVRLMLQTCGVNAKIAQMYPERVASMPDGKGGYADFYCRAVYRLLVSSNDLQLLLQLGFDPRRLEIKAHKPQRSASRFVTVTEVIDEGRVSDTYCFTEPKRHMGVFNGVLTGQCTEIFLPTNEDRTAVCCLSSVNAARWDEWQDDPLFISDLMKMLDNVLDDFIYRCETNPKFAGLWRAANSAKNERSVGLGLMGFHTLLQQRGIPFESPMAEGVNRTIFKHLDEETLSASKLLGRTRGEAPDMAGTGLRFAHRLAVAPNASSSIICGGVSPACEPYRANAYVEKTLSGSHLKKNPVLARLLAEKADDDPDLEAEWWNQVIEDQGSVQNLDCLDDMEKEVFRTAIEIDQRWIIQHAVARGGNICQGQSTNVFFPSEVAVKELHATHFIAWKGGLKSLYYLRSESAQRPENIQKKIEQSSTSFEEDVCLSCEG